MGSGGSGLTGGGLGCAKLALFVVEFFPILFEFAHHADPHFWNLGGIWVEAGWKLGGVGVLVLRSLALLATGKNVAGTKLGSEFLVVRCRRGRRYPSKIWYVC